MRKAIFYKGCWLMFGSVGHRLHTENKMIELDCHMKELHAAAVKRGEFR